jgi:hypothetical protein
MRADTECLGYRSQSGGCGLALHRAGADPDDQRATVLAAHGGAGRPGPDPDSYAHSPSLLRFLVIPSLGIQSSGVHARSVT